MRGSRKVWEAKKTAKKKAPSKEEPAKRRPPVQSYWAVQRVITDSTDAARDLYNQSRFGTLLEDGKVQLSLLEALYLVEKGRLQVNDSQGKCITFENFVKRAVKEEIGRAHV